MTFPIGSPPQHPALARILVEFDDMLTRVSLAIVQEGTDTRLHVANLMRTLAARGVGDTAILPDHSRLVCERVLTALWAKLGKDGATFTPMAMGAWLAAHAFAQEFEGCETCGEFAPRHADWCHRAPAPDAEAT